MRQRSKAGAVAQISQIKPTRQTRPTSQTGPTTSTSVLRVVLRAVAGVMLIGVVTSAAMTVTIAGAIAASNAAPIPVFVQMKKLIHKKTTPQKPALDQLGQQQTGWDRRVRRSGIGGHILGNPVAKNRLVEYVSYSCNHCAAFETASSQTLKTLHVRPGSLSVEIRNFVRDPIDLTAAMLARCGGKKKFFGNHHLLMTTQHRWLPKAQSASRETRQGWAQGEIDQRLKKIAAAVGFYKLMKQRGISRKQAETCLASGDDQARILDMTHHAQNILKLRGTPSFTLNGDVLKQVHGWPVLKPVLDRLR